jgi:hypothetical protein
MEILRYNVRQSSFGIRPFAYIRRVDNTINHLGSKTISAHRERRSPKPEGGEQAVGTLKK